MSRTSEKPFSTRAWTGIGLPVSVILNLFLAALIVGHLVQQPKSNVAPGAPGLARMLADAEASLSPPDAAVFGSVIRNDRSRYADAITEFIRARDRLSKQITSEPFDPAAVKQGLAAWRQSWNHLLDDFDDTLVEALAKISPDGRRRLIEDRKKGLTVSRPVD